MDRLVSYQNGNYTVTIDTTNGTKIRYNDLDNMVSAFPESMDIKITNKCDMGCPFCHENSKPNGKHADLESPSFIDSLHPYTELAIGGGNPLEHPGLVKFLEKCKTMNLIPSMTVNQVHFMHNLDLLHNLTDNKLLYGLGVSLVSPTDDFIKEIKKFPNAVIHVINGVVTIEDLEKLKNNNLKILILGYKIFRRGEDLYKQATHRPTLEVHMNDLYTKLPEILKEQWFNVVSFDNLSVVQLNVCRVMSKEAWEQFYMGDDGTATMFVDMVERTFSESSTTPIDKRYPITDNIVDMFNKIRK